MDLALEHADDIQSFAGAEIKATMAELGITLADAKAWIQDNCPDVAAKYFATDRQVDYCGMIDLALQHADSIESFAGDEIEKAMAEYGITAADAKAWIKKNMAAHGITLADVKAWIQNNCPDVAAKYF